MESSIIEDASLSMDGQRYLSTDMNLFYWAKLKVAGIMSTDVVTVAPNQTIREAAVIIAEKRISCVLVSADNQVVGILSQKDMMASALANGTSETVLISDKMSHPVKTIDPQSPVLYASMIMDQNAIKRLPVVSNQGLVGVVTQTDLVRAFESMNALRSVTEIMTTDVATITPDRSVAQAVNTMVKKQISSVLIVRNNKAEGILTEKDVLRTVLAQGRDPERTCVVDVMSFPLITIPPSHSVMSASRLMYDKHLHRLVVTDNQGTFGIVTRTDILKGYQTYAQRETQQGLHMLTHAADAIILLDVGGKTTYVNPAFLNLFGLDSPCLFIDKHFPPDELWVEQQDKDIFIAENAFDSGSIQKLFLRKTNGEYLSINMCFSNIKDMYGNTIGKQGVAWDLTQDIV